MCVSVLCPASHLDLLVCVEADLGGYRALEKHTVTSNPLTSELYKCIKAKKTEHFVCLYVCNERVRVNILKSYKALNDGC